MDPNVHYGLVWKWLPIIYLICTHMFLFQLVFTKQSYIATKYNSDNMPHFMRVRKTVSKHEIRGGGAKRRRCSKRRDKRGGICVVPLIRAVNNITGKLPSFIKSMKHAKAMYDAPFCVF